MSFVSKDLEVNPAIGDSEIDFMVSDGVLKTNDLFEYTAIIETPKGIKSLKDGLKLGPRRENLDYNYMFNETKKDDDMLFKSFISRIIVAIALFVLLLLLVWFNFSMPISFDYKALDKNTNREAFVYTSHHGDIYLADEEHELSLFSKHRITKEELFDNYTFKPIIGDDDTRKDLNAYQNYITYLMLSVPCLIMIVYFIDNYLAGRKKRNITRLLQKNKDTNK